jgi:hypothetical protein
MDPQQQSAAIPQRGPPPQTGDFSPILTVFLSFIAIFALVVALSPVF